MVQLFGRTMVLAYLFVGVSANAEEPATAKAKEPAKPAPVNLAVGDQAPAFKIADTTGKVIDLQDLTAKGPVLLRLTCGCSGCDKELAYFQQIHDFYKQKGLTCLFVFREPDAKMETYAKEKKLDMLYAVDPKGESFKVFQTRTMPTNFLIGKGGQIVGVAAGCDPSGLLANKVSEKVARSLQVDSVDVKKKVQEKK